MKNDLQTVLDHCLEEMRRGKSLEECLQAFPQWASQLKPLLRIAQSIEHLPRPEPSHEAVRSALIQMGRASALPKRQKAVGRRRFDLNFFFPKAAFVPALITAIVFIFVSFGTVMLSADSLPGDLLYPLKRITESVQYSLTTSPEGKAELRLALADKRLRELVKVINKRKGLDEALLKSMLQEVRSSLEEHAVALPKPRALLYLTKLSYVNDYQREVLEQLRSQVAPSERESIDTAISVCHQRGQWMRKMMREGVLRPCWGPGCYWTK